MPNVKTAVSLPPDVFAGFSALAVARGSSRSGVIASLFFINRRRIFDSFTTTPRA